MKADNVSNVQPRISSITVLWFCYRDRAKTALYEVERNAIKLPDPAEVVTANSTS